MGVAGGQRDGGGCAAGVGRHGGHPSSGFSRALSRRTRIFRWRILLGIGLNRELLEELALG
jgi:hypothetical protein